jgi:putative Mg2+ transporter-C (MgtC) family protein
LQGLVGSGLALRGLDSNDVDAGGRVAVTAHLTASNRVDADVEKIVGRLSLEPAVTAASWQAEVRLDSEGRSSLGQR